MNVEYFWRLIKTSQRGTENCGDQAEKLTAQLADLGADEIEAFDQILHERLNDAYRWDLWAVATIVNGGCSDDGFLYFRGWLVAQGQEYFEDALAHPPAAARKVIPGDFVECEQMLYVALDAYEQKTGKPDLPPHHIPHPPTPAGVKWEQSDLERLYPKLVRRFG